MGGTRHVALAGGTAAALLTADIALKERARRNTDDPLHRFGSMGPLHLVRFDDPSGGPAGRMTGLGANRAVEASVLGSGAVIAAALVSGTRSKLGAVAGGLVLGATLSNQGEALLRDVVTNHVGYSSGGGSVTGVNLADISMVAFFPLAAVATIRALRAR